MIAPPKKIPVFLRIGIWISRRATGKDLLVPKLLAWYPKAAIGSGVLEALVAHHDREVSSRLLKLVRMKVSFTASCPFCQDMNSFRYQQEGISVEEIMALQDRRPLESVASFSLRERLAIRYAEAVTRTPLFFSDELRKEVGEAFSEREIVILSTTAAQVNYWARLVQALGVPPAGFLPEGLPES